MGETASARTERELAELRGQIDADVDYLLARLRDDADPRNLARRQPIAVFGTLGSLAAALSRSPCNATLEQGAFDQAMPRLREDASALGFTLAAGWDYGVACSATYWVTLVERGVAGATGSFDWTVRGSGTTA